jgi:hypothetical protein
VTQGGFARPSKVASAIGEAGLVTATIVLGAIGLPFASALGMAGLSLLWWAFGRWPQIRAMGVARLFGAVLLAAFLYVAVHAFAWALGWTLHSQVT